MCQLFIRAQPRIWQLGLIKEDAIIHWSPILACFDQLGRILHTRHITISCWIRRSYVPIEYDQTIPINYCRIEPYWKSDWISTIILKGYFTSKSVYYHHHIMFYLAWKVPKGTPCLYLCMYSKLYTCRRRRLIMLFAKLWPATCLKTT